ncbi:MAG: nucleotidyltransferase family protein [Gemmatimonadaceae bacterium]
MAYQSTLDEGAQNTNTFYRRTLHVLSDAQVPFLVGGSHAFLHYTGIVRNTKDFDLFVDRENFDRAMEALSLGGYRTETTFPHWLGKAMQGDDFVDLVFASGNGVCQVDQLWFDNAVEASVLGMPVKLMPVEELIWQKSFIMERDRFDGADIAHMLRMRAESLDWDRLMQRFDRYWNLLLSHLVLFTFVYPCEKDKIPRHVFDALFERMRAHLDAPHSEEKVCQGTLVSRAQYLLDIGRYGYADARLQPRGNMTPEDVIYWTWAIEHIE